MPDEADEDRAFVGFLTDIQQDTADSGVTTSANQATSTLTNKGLHGKHYRIFHYLAKEYDFDVNNIKISFDVDGYRARQVINQEYEYNNYNPLSSAVHTLYRTVSRKPLANVSYKTCTGASLSTFPSLSIGHLKTASVQLEEFIVITGFSTTEAATKIIDDISKQYKSILFNLVYNRNCKELLRIVQHTRK